MQPDATKLFIIAGIRTPLIGFYDVSDPEPFAPFTEPKRCYFSAYENWLKGESICVTRGGCKCQGGSYWIGGVMPDYAMRSEETDGEPLENYARTLNQREGFKSSDELMHQWLKNQKPYLIENGYVVIGPLKEEQYEHLKTVTFYVNPDQLSLLLLGTEYHNASVNEHPTISAFGSGCGQMAAVLGDVDNKTPRAVLGATDIAMREHLPPDMLALTVNKAMFEQLCGLDEDSFLYKHFWKRLRQARGER